jgi:pSer/pThr/pTyr-binding forkhead associated (FHA) protein
MPAQLLALTDGPSILLDKPILLLGRHGECDVQLNSRKVSRRHCCIAQVNDYLIVRDLGSTNGVRINGQRVIEGRLRGGDELTVGNFRYQVSMEAASSAAGPPPIQLPVPVDSELEWSDEPVPLDEATAKAGSGRILPSKPAQRSDEPLVLPDNLRNPPPPDDESSQ